MRWPVLAALLAALPLAGCASDGFDDDGRKVELGETIPVELANATFYAFRHDGGQLRFVLEGNGSASLVLYDGLDRRVSAIEIGSGEDQAAAVGKTLPAGDPVVRIESVLGDLRIESDGHRVSAFRPLTSTVERVPLVSRSSDPAGGLVPGSDSIDETLPAAFQRAPSALRLLASDQYTDLEVDVSSTTGPVLVASASSEFVAAQPSYFTGASFSALEADVYPENFSDGAFEAHVRAAHLRGALVLEAEVYSRAEVAGTHQATSAEGEPEFWFAGTLLTDRPMQFEVADGTQWISLRQPADEDVDAQSPEPDAQPVPVPALAHVALFDRDDVRIATVELPYNVTLRVPAGEPGTYVVALLAGNARLGLDRAPADIQTYPMDTGSVIVPDRPAGTTMRYGQANASIPTIGVPYKLVAAVTTSGNTQPFGTGFIGCGDSSIVRLEQDGEGLFVNGQLMPGLTSDALAGSLRLQPGAMQVRWDGFGEQGCPRPAIEVFGFVRGGTPNMD